MDRLEVYDRYKVTTHTEVETMSKLHLSIISLGLCLILGFGSLAAQKGKKKEPKTTFDVTVVAGTDGPPTGESWWITAPTASCVGFAEGSNLGAYLFGDSCELIEVSGLMLHPLQISAKITRKATRVQIFWRDQFGVHYHTDELTAEEVVNHPASYTDFDIVLNATNVPITEVHGSNPVITTINVGKVQYIAQTP